MCSNKTLLQKQAEGQICCFEDACTILVPASQLAVLSLVLFFNWNLLKDCHITYLMKASVI
jgi:hypothetical protein